MAPGFLAVFSEPGSEVSLEEFQDWYNNEHIPLRMNHPSFHTGARFHAIDSKTPSWFAVYDIADTSVFESESYTRFRTDRSPREVDLIGRLQLLDRRTSQLLDDSGISDKTTSYHFENPTKVIVTYGASAESDEAFGAWAKKTFEALRAVDGWVRTRTYHVFDIVKTGLSVGKGAEEQKAPKYLVIHEFVDATVPDSEAYRAALQHVGSQGVTLEDIRKFELYRSYKSVAARIV